jgi:hypothetical protein
MQCGTALGATVFGQLWASCRNAAFAGSDSLFAAIGAWVSSSIIAWLFAAALAVAVIPFTLLIILLVNKQLLELLVNKQLLEPSLDRNSDAVRQLLTRWGRLHAVRTVLGRAAFAVFLLLR